MARVLLVDSQPLFNEPLEALFARDGKHKVIGRCSSRSEAFTVLQSLDPDRWWCWATTTTRPADGGDPGRRGGGGQYYPRC